MRAKQNLEMIGMTPTDRATGSILSAMAAAGTFRLGGTIVGTNAFRLYEGDLGVRLPLGVMANTGDIAQFEKLSVGFSSRFRARSAMQSTS